MPTVILNRLSIDVPDTAALLGAANLGPGALLLCENSAVQTGPFVQFASIPLVAGQSTYSFYDLTGTSTTWYRDRLSNSGGTTFTPYSITFQAPTPIQQPATSAMFCTLGDFKSRVGGDVPNMDGSFDTTIITHIIDVCDGINTEVQTMRAQPEGWGFLPGAAATRRYTGYPGGTDMLVIDDAVSISSVAILSTNGVLQSTLVAGTDYLTYPLNTLPIVALRAVSTGQYPTWPTDLGTVQITLTPGYALTIPPDIHDVALTESIRAYMSARAGENDQVGIGPLGTVVTSKAFTDKSRRILNRYSNRMGWFR